MKLNIFFFKRINKKSNRDSVFNSLWVQKIINNIKKHISIAVAEKLVYNTLSYLKKFYKINIPILLFKLIKNQKLVFKTTKVRVAGRSYYLPIGFNEYNRYAMSFRELIKQITLQRTNSFVVKFLELINNNLILQQNASTKKRQEIYGALSDHRGYLHYRWRL
jgi:ribosomal protein S7